MPTRPINLLDYFTVEQIDQFRAINEVGGWGLGAPTEPDGGFGLRAPESFLKRFDAGTPTLVILSHLAVARAIDGGAKVIRPNASVCRAMAAIDLRLTAADYSQPYESLGVVLPAEFVGKDRPSFLTVWWDARAGIHACVLDGKKWQSDTMSVSWDGLIEDHLGNRDDDDYDEPPVDPEHFPSLVRVALNLGLFAVERHRLAPLPPDAAKRAARAPRDDRMARLAARDGQEIVVQGLDLILAERRPVGHLEPTGEHAKQRAHRRRGHWKMQPCGPKQSMRERRYIKSYLVNSKGEPIDTVIS